MHYRIRLHEAVITDLEADSFDDRTAGGVPFVQFYRKGKTVLCFPVSSLVSIEKIQKPKTKDNA